MNINEIDELLNIAIQMNRDILIDEILNPSPSTGNSKTIIWGVKPVLEIAKIKGYSTLSDNDKAVLIHFKNSYAR
jgi:hypothetical protein